MGTNCFIIHRLFDVLLPVKAVWCSSQLVRRRILKNVCSIPSTANALKPCSKDAAREFKILDDVSASAL